jgi:hypothetical protein
MWIVGAILIAVGVGLFFYKKKVEDKLLDVKYYDKSDIKSALETCLSVSQELGTGHYSQMVKFSAKAQIEEPCVGEFSNDKCVYFEASAVHKFEKLVESKDSEGKVQRRWVSGSSTIGSMKEGGEFMLNDGSGEIAIDIDGSDLTMEYAVNNFKSTTSPKRFSFGAYQPESSRKKKSQGYQEIERNIPVGQQLFIIGELHDRNGTPAVTRSAEKKNPFIVSVHSEDEVIGGLESKVKAVFYGAIACLVIGASLVVANFFV